MRLLEQTIRFSVYDRLEELRPEDRELLLQARVSVNRAYAPYSQFKVGASARLQSGEIISGANQENAAYPMCQCAEQVVLGHCGASHPHDPILRFAITARSPRIHLENPVSPCGACRQILLEYEQRQQHPIELLLQGESGPIYLIPNARALLPLCFDGSAL